MPVKTLSQFLIVPLVLGALLLTAPRMLGADRPPTVPKIMLTEAVLERLNTDRAADPELEADYQSLITSAEASLSGSTIAEELQEKYQGDPTAIRHFGEKAVERLTTLGMAWRTTGDRRFARRGRSELLGLAKLDTWNPAHFLGLTRITLAVALGYSWMSDTLSDDDHTIIQAALVDKALTEGLRIYDQDQYYFDSGWITPHQWIPPVDVPDTLPDGTATADISWPVASFNWNIVCNTGLVMAALALSEARPDLAADVINRAQISLRNGFSLFAPDGAWPEGPMYGALSARDAAQLVTALESVIGHDFDLSKAAGMPSFGDYLMHVTGPTGLLFNYGDSDTITDTVVLPWLSSRFDRPDYDWRKTGSPGSSTPALNLIWRQSEGLSPAAKEPTSLWFGGYGLVTMRSAWNDTNATYVGFKAGPLQSHHNNLDTGTFVIDALGERWAVDLGKGNYDLPGYFTSKRFDYYRTASMGQNTLVFDSANQRETGRGNIEDFGQVPNFSFTIADLSDAYGARPRSVRRGVALIQDDTVLIQDEIAKDQTDPVLWTMHTPATPRLTGNRATLTQNGKEMTAVILSPVGARFEVRSANPCDTPYNASCDMQSANAGLQRLVISFDGPPATELRRITVLISPDVAEASAVIPNVIALDEWRLRATIPRKGATGLPVTGMSN
ncbi:MAG: heparinase II/III-family protein [Alphaproteobacteria bacterium]|nr:heparinase II/III-family protein [Alphaproteobacteria bacterium]